MRDDHAQNDSGGRNTMIWIFERQRPNALERFVGERETMRKKREKEREEERERKKKKKRNCKRNIFKHYTLLNSEEGE